MRNSRTRTIALRIVVFLLLEGLLFAGGFALLIVAAFSGSSFYLNMLYAGFPAVAISLGLFILLPRFRRYAWISFPALSVFFLLVFLIQSVMLYVDEQVPVLSDGINIAGFQPFSPSVPRLPDASSLKLDSNLPVLDGALALYPLYAAVATAVYPEKSYSPVTNRGYSVSAYYKGSSQNKDHEPHEVHFTNTVDAFQGLLYGRVDICFLADISDEQQALAAGQGVELVYTPIGREAFVFFVNANNPVDSLTVEQIQEIYSGKLRHWAKVGGAGTITAFQRNKNSGSQSALERLMQGYHLMEPPTTEKPAGMGGIIRHVADYKNYSGAIGFTFRYFATHMAENQDIKLLKIDGVEPSKENVADGSYPLTVQFYAVSLRSNSKPNVHRMLEFLTSSQGQYLVEQVGYVSLEDNPRQDGVIEGFGK